MYKLEPRREPSQTMFYAAPLLAVAATFISAMIIFALMRINPFVGVYQMFISAIVEADDWPDLLIKAAPLIMIAVGLSIGFRANVWNIGAEGQHVMGAVAGTGVALAFWSADDPPAMWWILPLMAIAGALGGMAWASIPALLRTRFHVSEILTSLMLNYVAILFLDYLVRAPWNDPDGHGFLQTRQFTDSESLPMIMDGSRIHIGVPIAFVLAILAFVVMERTLFGYQVRVVGGAPKAAAHGGFSARRTIWQTFLIGGGFAGLAGILEAAGPFTQLTPNFPQNYGYTAIIVAFLGRLNPLGIIIGGLVLAVTYLGGEHAQTSVGLPQAATGMFQAMMLFFLLAVDILVRYRLVSTRPAAPTAPAPVSIPQPVSQGAAQ